MLLALYYSPLMATTDLAVPVTEIIHRSEFNIPVFLDPSNECPGSPLCDAPAYRGELTLRVSVQPDSGKLAYFDWRLDGRMIPVRLPPELLGHRVMLWNLRVIQSASYLPAEYREFVSGIGRPVVYLSGLSFLDPECSAGGRELRIIYDLELDEVEVLDYCHEPDEQE